MPPSRTQLEEWIVQLERELEEFEQFWAKMPRWAVVAAVIGIAVMFYRPLWGFFALLIGLSFVGCAAWILGVRRREHRDDIDIAKERLDRLYGGPTSAP